MNFAYLFKWIVVGDQSVGKSSIVMQFLHEEFRPDCETTIGVEFASKTLLLDHLPIKLQIWDTAGQEAFQSITRSYYRGTIAALLVYDVSSRRSFEHLDKWLEETSNFATTESIVVVLIANKIDIAQREVTPEQGAEYAEEKGLLFFQCSAKSGKNVKRVFEEVAREVLERIKRGEVEVGENGGVRLGDHPITSPPKEEKKCC